MLFRLLGPVSVVGDDGGTCNVDAPRQRALLALLALRANRVLSASAAIEGLWGEDLPVHPSGALQVVMSRLRRVLGSAADRIRSEGGGYRLEAAPDEVDVTRVEGLLRAGRSALAEHDARRAATLLDTALEHWVGEPLEGLEGFSFHAAAVQRLSELHWTVYEARCTAYLLEGRHLEVLADIGEWIAGNPLSEHIRALQVVALYRSGRQADALSACAELRAGLRRELGVGLSTDFQELERKVLDHDPDLLAADAGLTVPMPAWTSETIAFVDRDAEFEVARASLRGAIEHGFRLLLVEGESGSGKSRFLLEFARRFGRDTIVVPVDVHESLNPSVISLARALRDAAHRLKPHELAALLSVTPEFAAILEPGAPSQDAVLAHGARWLAALSTKAPVVLLVDELDHASPKLLHVIGRVLPVDVKRVLVVGSAGGADATSVPSLHRLLDALERNDRLDRIVMPPLGESDINELLERMVIVPGRRRVLAKQLLELTSGSPFLLAELLSTGQPEHIAEEWTVPPRVRDVVLAHLDSLGRTTSQAIQAASVFRYEFNVGLLAEILGLPESTVSNIVARAVDAQILQPNGLRTFRFSHQLARRTIAASLTPEARAEAHRHAALAIERAATDEPLARLAYQWSLAAGPDATEKTIEYAARAGDEARRMLEPAYAVLWYELALERLGANPGRGPLLVSLAEVRYLGGIPEYVDALREAADLALETNDGDLLVRVVTFASLTWDVLPGLPHSQRRLLLDRAVEAARDDATRSRVLVRKAAYDSFRKPRECEGMAAEALALARRSGDAAALLDTLNHHAAMAHDPGSVARRRAEVEEALPLAATAADDFTRYLLANSGMIAALQQADPDGFEHYAAIADHVTGRNSLPPLVCHQMARRAMLAGLAGRLEDAESLVHDARHYGITNQLPYARYVALVQLAHIRWHQGQAGSLVDDARRALDRFGPMPGAQCALIRALAARDGGCQEARERLRRLAAEQFTDLPPGTFWSTMLVLLAESACLLDMPDVAEVLRPMFDPYLDQVAYNGAWVAAPMAHGAGCAAAALGATDRDELFDLAVDIARRLNAPLLEARAERARATKAP